MPRSTPATEPFLPRIARADLGQRLGRLCGSDGVARLADERIEVGRGHRLPQAALDLASVASSPKAFGSSTAICARTLRSISMPASFSPCMKRL